MASGAGPDYCERCALPVVVVPLESVCYLYSTYARWHFLIQALTLVLPPYIVDTSSLGNLLIEPWYVVVSYYFGQQIIICCPPNIFIVAIIFISHCYSLVTDSILSTTKSARKNSAFEMVRPTPHWWRRQFVPTPEQW